MARIPPPPPSQIGGPGSMGRTTSIEVSPEMEDFCGVLGRPMGDSSVGEDFGLELGLQLQGSANGNGRLNPKEDGSWRRHMSLELEPLVPQAPGCCTGPIKTDQGLGKSMSVQDLVQVAPVHETRHSLSSPSPSTSSDSPVGFHSHSQDPGGGGSGAGRGGGGGWGEEDLFISDRDTEAQAFDFLGQGTVEAQGFSSDLLRTGGQAGMSSRGSNQNPASGHIPPSPAGNTELLNMPHVRLK